MLAAVAGTTALKDGVNESTSAESDLKRSRAIYPHLNPLPEGEAAEKICYGQLFPLPRGEEDTECQVRVAELWLSPY